ncbi:hypothetical protein NHX12_019278 [Muraenolepis orangiensis]|uniref:Potassium voltage-gated channel subfamily H member 5 n=1 Tax=Muraenolepis orangiensis TaxID=630683 RepID=A0A9Q0EYH1_9TELE|nr:hypothetical protein NHX12_019278 [Muraenolepis orangiensis]
MYDHRALIGNTENNKPPGGMSDTRMTSRCVSWQMVLDCLRFCFLAKDPSRLKSQNRSPQQQISEVKKEEEERQRARNEVQLTIPQDHPVRKLFQKFKQQKELRTQGPSGSSQADPEKNRQHHQHHQHLHPHSLQLGHSVLQHSLPLALQRPSPPHLSHSSLQQNGGPSGSSVLTVSQVTPMQSYAAAKQNNCDIMEMQPSPAATLAGGDGTRALGPRTGAGSPPPAPSKPAARGWMRLRNNSAVPPPQTLGREGLNNNNALVPKAVSVEMLSRGEAGEGGRDPEEEGVPADNPLRKTDSCDSGITQSELRIDRAGGTPLLLHSPLLPLLPTGGGGASFGPAGPEQALLQAALQETRLELRGDIRTLGGRLGALEGQVARIIGLLSGGEETRGRRGEETQGKEPSPQGGPPRPATPRVRVKRQDIFTVSRPVSPDSEKEASEGL